jgi:hypothetical protein
MVTGFHRWRTSFEIQRNGLKLPLLRHPVKGGVTLERAHVARKQAEANGASAVARSAANSRNRALSGFGER